MHMKILIAMFLLLAPCAGSQQEPAAPGEQPLSESAETVAPEIPPLGLDSLYRSLALIEIAKADEAVAASNFWQRLIPHVSVNGGIGMRDLAFTDGTGSLTLPKDSYRLTVALSLSDLFDGSACARAEIQRAEAETRFLILSRKQSLARLALLRKKDDVAGELAALREELAVRTSLGAFQELLFTQGRIDFRALSEVKIDLIRLKHSVAGLSFRLRDIDRLLAGAAGQ
jgi:hypothetical protein